ncbi:MAG: 30S ribosomal protein S4 [Candidatus Krumholzibacteria bacterium]|nr:30S ribosomal protein S4 [Candidatus Krumholzibacteria bacterium]
MARYLGAKCKMCRRDGVKLFLKGDRCYSDKCEIEKRNYPPGEHGRTRYSRKSSYRNQLREKQKLRRMYLLLEAQFRNYYYRAVKMKGVTGANLLKLLEQRLDNMVFRMGFTPSRETARQLVLHKHFEVNGRIVDRPSFQLKPGDRVTVREKSRNLLVVEESLKKYGSRGTVPYISVDVDKREGVYLEAPTREMIPVPIEENIIVELYSK